MEVLSWEVGAWGWAVALEAKALPLEGDSGVACGSTHTAVVPLSSMLTSTHIQCH